MTDIVERPALHSSAQKATARSFLMCRPTYFRVEYEINAWMDASVPVDAELAVSQWEVLRDTYVALGHTVHELQPVAELPDMVFSANGGFSVDGIVLGANFKHPQRALEAAEHRAWYSAHHWNNYSAGRSVNEGEGDFTYVREYDMVLAGWGFRTDLNAHIEAEQVFHRRVASLQLIDERFYHLDTALFVLDDANVCYFPEAFSSESRRLLQELFPQAVLATEADALAFGLNSVSDGHNVIVPVAASGLARVLADKGFVVHTVDLSELVKGGGSVKCCTGELRY